MQTATHLEVETTETSQGQDKRHCAWRTTEGGKLATGMTVRSPAAPVGTLADIRARFVAGNSVFTDRPDLGNGAFEAQSKPPAGVVTLACDVFMTAPNGNTTQISVTYAQGPADDVCGYAEEIAGLVH